ncbi:hypothetical protein NHG85_06605, partial [Limimaricola sp. ASW11-118]|nr:hypothetical protein [Limimaricola litoreus]
EAAARRRGPAAAAPAMEAASEPEAEPGPLDAAPEEGSEAEAVPAFDDAPDAGPDGGEDIDLAPDGEDDDEGMDAAAGRTAAAPAEPEDHDLSEVSRPDEAPASDPARHEASGAPFASEAEPAAPGEDEAETPAPARYDPFEENDEDEAEIDFETVTPDRPTTGPDAPRIESRDLWEEEEDEADSDFERLLRGERLEAEADPDARARQADLDAARAAAMPLPGVSDDRDEAPDSGDAMPTLPQEDMPPEPGSDTLAPPGEAAPFEDRVDDDLDDPALMASLSAENPDESRSPAAPAPFEPLPRDGREDDAGPEGPDDRAARETQAEPEDRAEPAETVEPDTAGPGASDDMADTGDGIAPDPASDSEAERETPDALDEAPEDAARQRASMAAASTGAVTRRDLLPDIEEINSSLRSTAMRGPAHRASDLGEVRRGSGFRLGFGTALLIAAALALIYSHAGRIGAALPPLAEPLDAFAGSVDMLRGQLDAWLRGLLAMLG